MPFRLLNKQRLYVVLSTSTRQHRREALIKQKISQLYICDRFEFTLQILHHKINTFQQANVFITTEAEELTEVEMKDSILRRQIYYILYIQTSKALFDRHLSFEFHKCMSQ